MRSLPVFAIAGALLLVCSRWRAHRMRRRLERIGRNARREMRREVEQWEQRNGRGW